MIKRLLVVFAVLAATASFATPVSAQGGLPCDPTARGNGAAGCTIHAANLPISMPLGVVVCRDGTVLPAGFLQASVSGVFHITVMGDQLWETSTLQGAMTITQTTNGVNYTGHLETWFGESINTSNVVFHVTFNVIAHGSDGSIIVFHLVMQFATNANNQIVVNSTHITCS